MKLTVVVFLLLSSITVMSNELNGLFVVEENHHSNRKTIETKLSSTVDKNLSDTNSLLIKYKKRFEIFYAYGLEFRYNDNSVSNEGKALRENLNSQGISFNIIKPKYSLYGHFGLSPFLGKLNFFNSSFFDLYININVGAGLTSYEVNSAWSENSTSSFYSELEFETKLGETYTLNIGSRKTYDSLENDKSNNYTDIFIGLGYLF